MATKKQKKEKQVLGSLSTTTHSEETEKESLSQNNSGPFSCGDTVSCSFKGCTGSEFMVARVHSSSNCYSKWLVVAHLKGDKAREIKGTIIDGINYGIDSGWFQKID